MLHILSFSCQGFVACTIDSYSIEGAVISILILRWRIENAPFTFPEHYPPEQFLVVASPACHHGELHQLFHRVHDALIARSTERLFCHSLSCARSIAGQLSATLIARRCEWCSAGCWVSFRANAASSLKDKSHRIRQCGYSVTSALSSAASTAGRSKTPRVNWIYGGLVCSYWIGPGFTIRGWEKKENLISQRSGLWHSSG